MLLPLDTAYTGTGIDYFLSDAEPRLFVVKSETLDRHRERGADPINPALSPNGEELK